MQDWNILTSRWVQMDVVDVDEDVRRLSANRRVTLAESVGGLALALSHKRDDALAFQSRLLSSPNEQRTSSRVGDQKNGKFSKLTA